MGKGCFDMQILRLTMLTFLFLPSFKENFCHGVSFRHLAPWVPSTVPTIQGIKWRNGDTFVLVELTSQVKPGTPPHRRPAACWLKKCSLEKVALANFTSALRLQILLAEAQQMYRYESLIHETGSLCGFQLFNRVF